jgi:hypothetical protein
MQVQTHQKKTRWRSWLTGLQPPDMIGPLCEFEVLGFGEFQHKVDVWRFATSKGKPDFALRDNN